MLSLSCTIELPSRSRSVIFGASLPPQLRHEQRDRGQVRYRPLNSPSSAPPRHNPRISNSHFHFPCTIINSNSTTSVEHSPGILNLNYSGDLSKKATMGLFGSTTPSTIPAPKTSSDGTPIAPDRSARQKCWDARDTYFACLDKHGIVDSIRNKEEAEKACPKEGETLAGNCASSWVSACYTMDERRDGGGQRDATGGKGNCLRGGAY